MVQWEFFYSGWNLTTNHIADTYLTSKRATKQSDDITHSSIHCAAYGGVGKTNNMFPNSRKRNFDATVLREPGMKT